MKKVVAFTVCDNRLVDIEPLNNSQWLCPLQEIIGSIKVRITGISAIVTMKESFITNTEFSTTGTSLGSICWIDSHKHMTIPYCFIFNELSQLESTPITYSSIKDSASVPFTYSCQILHNKECSNFNTFNNLFAYYMVHIASKPFLSAFKHFQMFFGRFCAFTLKPCFKASEPINMMFDTAEELSVAGNSKMVDTQVNTNNRFDRANVDVNLISNTKMEIEFSTSQKQFTFSNVPFSIFGEVFRDSDWYLNPSINCANAQNIVFNGETSWWVIPDATIKDWLGLRLFTAFISTFDCSYNQLRLELWEFNPHIFINSIIKPEIGFISFPTNINSIVDSIRIDRKSVPDGNIIYNLDFDSGSILHIHIKTPIVYKPYASLSSVQWYINTRKYCEFVNPNSPHA
jgi:hypothetical protein